MISAEEYFKKEYGEGHIKRAIELNDLQSIYTLMEEFADNTMQVKNNDLLHSVSERYPKDCLMQYPDGWYVCFLNKITKKYVKVSTAFKTKAIADTERKLLNAR